MADRMRGTHQRGQAATRAQPLPIQGRRRNGALGRARRGRRQPHQHRPRNGKTIRPVGPDAQPKLPPIRRPPTAGFALRVIDHSPGNVNFAPESSYQSLSFLDIGSGAFAEAEEVGECGLRIGESVIKPADVKQRSSNVRAYLTGIKNITRFFVVTNALPKMMKCTVAATSVLISEAECVVVCSVTDDVSLGRHFEGLAIQVRRIYQIASKLLRWACDCTRFHEPFQGDLAQ